jgi:hypothetical protein
MDKSLIFDYRVCVCKVVTKVEQSSQLRLVKAVK